MMKRVILRSFIWWLAGVQVKFEVGCTRGKMCEEALGISQTWEKSHNQCQHRAGKERMDKSDISKEKSMALFDWLDLKRGSKVNF